jgi:hypothetical protein
MWQSKKGSTKMALGISFENKSGSSAKIIPAAKFDAKYGKLLVVNKTPSDEPGKWDSEDVEVAAGTKIVVDMENVLLGWVTFKPYSAAFARIGEKIPAQPSAEHKFAVRIPMFFKEHGVREMTPTSKTVQRAFDRLHDEYIAGFQANPGKLPVVTLKGKKQIKVKTPEGDLKFHEPDWSITAWVDRPAAFELQEAPQSQAPIKAAPTVQPDDLEEF